MSLRRAWPLWLALLALGACAPVRLRESPQAEAAQAAREAALGPRMQWTLTAHIAVSDGHYGGSGELTWRQDGARYDFSVRAPVTGRTWHLAGDADGAVLEGVDPQPLHGDDGAMLLRERLGWDVPLADLAAWVRGLRAAAAPAEVRYDAAQRPAVIAQAGWRVEYRDWFDDHDPPLPRKVYASRGPAHVRLVVESWDLKP